MNNQLVDSIVQVIRNLSAAEKDLVQQKLSIFFSAQSAEHKNRPTVADSGKVSMRRHLAARRSIFAQQSQQTAQYRSLSEWQELMDGDIIDD
jgi:hypothetical protein